LIPTLEVIRQLTTPIEAGGYGATVVFCTATQPAFETAALKPLIGDIEIHEIVPQFEDHFAALKRVEYDWRRKPLTWAELAEEIRPLPQVMVVLNTRKDALAVLETMRGEENVFHLSALLCGAHRRIVLSRVRELLKQGKPVKLICTQVVECGVDIDFPVVYRALGPLDRVVQAAGRCNRNFAWAKGLVVIFEAAEGSAPSGPYKIGIEKAKLIMRKRDAKELHDPALYREYFDQLFHAVESGEDNLGKQVQDARDALNFPEVDRLYRLIRQDTVPVVVPFGDEWAQRLDDWLVAIRAMPRDRIAVQRAWQRLQPYIVNLYEHERSGNEDTVVEIVPGLYEWKGIYDSKRHRGIVTMDFTDPSDLIVEG
jgi:CRISPR-associated endonuclease/helicase Cas3